MAEEDRDLRDLHEQARWKLARAFSEELSGPPPGAEERILTSVELDRRRGGVPWLGAFAAIVLAALTVTALMAPRLLAQGQRTPAGSSGTAPSAQPPCRLPVAWGGGGAFVTISGEPAPAGQARSLTPSPDPGGRPLLPDGEAPQAISYRWDLHRWLPVRQEWVSPDGTRYAYADRQGMLHVADVATGHDRLLNGSSGWALIAFDGTGIYAGMTTGDADAPFHRGLWVIDPDTGIARALQAGGTWVAVSGGVAWGLTISPPSAPPKSTWPDGLYGNTLVALDLRDNRLTTWDAQHDIQFRVVGLDSRGDVLISEEPGTAELTPLQVVTGPNAAVRFTPGLWVDAVADGEATWLAQASGGQVYRKEGGTLVLVGEVRPAGGGDLRIAGPCR